jgi:hypothetical protein
VVFRVQEEHPDLLLGCAAHCHSKIGKQPGIARDDRSPVEVGPERLRHNAPDRGEVLRGGAVLDHQREIIAVLGKDRRKGAERVKCACCV